MLFIDNGVYLAFRSSGTKGLLLFSFPFSNWFIFFNFSDLKGMKKQIMCSTIRIRCLESENRPKMHKRGKREKSIGRKSRIKKK